MSAERDDTAGTGRKKGGLQAFQASLLARMEAASSEELLARRLAATIGPFHCLIRLTEAGEILPLSSLPAPMKVPLTQPWYLGLVNLRGNLVGIADLAVLSGFPAQAHGRDSRVLAFSPALAPNCGLLLSSVLGLRHISEMTQISKNYDDKNELIGVVGRYKDTAGTEWHEIGLATLLKEAAFLHIGR
ncbi:chemotaxis protein CheW [Herbaspirillum sp.]|uniref:chemotaxis protein CheW n=1 Tax=Herbaspirillum sp. TaxID=1890675 RepID=UPI001B16CCF8|nr:chemotaxis protein CheW [Herbaspirillum sp.]MBO9538704.1 chemotaxis protein CheW [Herbaspirillum sp.]